MYFHRGLFASLFSVVLSGCAATASDYMRTSEQKLCMDYLSFPSYNIHQPAREEAIQIRGINCAPYAGAAGARIRANQNFENVLRGLAAQPSYQGAPSYSTGTTCHYTRDVTSGMNKICHYNCLGSGHAMTVGAAQICPLTTVR
jgi:hypothetical protein